MSETDLLTVAAIFATVFFIKLVSNKMIERLKLKIERLTDLKEKIKKYKGRYN